MCVSFISELFVAPFVYSPPGIHEQLEPLEIRSGWVPYSAHVVVYQVAGVSKVFILALPYDVLREDLFVLFREFEKPPKIMGVFALIENSAQSD
jgi:hypothetical protein